MEEETTGVLWGKMDAEVIFLMCLSTLEADFGRLASNCRTNEIEMKEAKKQFDTNSCVWGHVTFTAGPECKHTMRIVVDDNNSTHVLEW